MAGATQHGGYTGRDSLGIDFPPGFCGPSGQDACSCTYANTCSHIFTCYNSTSAYPYANAHHHTYPYAGAHDYTIASAGAVYNSNSV